MLHRTRHLFIRQQTAVINAIRAHLGVFGIVAPIERNGVEELLDVAPAVVSGYGELAPVFDLIFHFQTGTAAERVPANINAFTKTRSFIQPIGLI